jgi:hypothetical protein
MSQQELAARRFRERQLSTGVNGAKMVEVLLARGQTEQMSRFVGDLNADKLVEWQLGDAELHALSI